MTCKLYMLDLHHNCLRSKAVSSVFKRLPVNLILDPILTRQSTVLPVTSPLNLRVPFHFFFFFKSHFHASSGITKISLCESVIPL